MRAALADAAGRDRLAGHQTRREHGRRVREGAGERAVLDAVLQHRHHGALVAQRSEPAGGPCGLMGLDREQHPRHRSRGRRIPAHPARQRMHPALRQLDHRRRRGPAAAQRDLVPGTLAAAAPNYRSDDGPGPVTTAMPVIDKVSLDSS